MDITIEDWLVTFDTLVGPVHVGCHKAARAGFKRALEIMDAQSQDYRPFLLANAIQLAHTLEASIK